jgi:replicative DNA helicase
MVRSIEVDRGARVERVPPNNLEAEESVLGAMMLSSDAIADVVEVLHPDDFYRTAHGRIYSTIQAVYARGDAVDAVTVKEELTRRDLLAEVGGPLRILELVEQVPSPASAPYYARIVWQHALLRRLIDAAGTIMTRAYAVPEEPERAADEAEALIYAVARREDHEETVALQPVIAQALDEIEHLDRRGSQLAGLATGFHDLDEKLSGLQKSNLVVLAARPSVGKSALATNVARNVAVQAREPVLFFSVEMSRWEIGMRLLCTEAKVPMTKVRAARLAPQEYGAFTEASESLHDAPIHIVDSGHLTLLDVRAKARRLKSRLGRLGLIVVDYLQLMSHHTRVENRQQEIAEISRGLKSLAKELDVPVLALSQLNREPERRGSGVPQLADLRESGSIEQDADVVMFIHREKNPEGQWARDTADLIIAKHRNGPTGKVELAFNSELIEFKNLYRGPGEG